MKKKFWIYLYYGVLFPFYSIYACFCGAIFYMVLYWKSAREVANKGGGSSV